MTLSYGNANYLATFVPTVVTFTIVLIFKLLFVSLLLRLSAVKLGKELKIGKIGVSKTGWITLAIIIITMSVLSAKVLEYRAQAPQPEVPVVEYKDTWRGAYFEDCGEGRCREISATIKYENINECIQASRQSFEQQKFDMYNQHTHIKPVGTYVCTLNCSWPPNGCDEMRVIPYEVISTTDEIEKEYMPDDFQIIEFKTKK